MPIENPTALTDPPTAPDPNDRATFDSRAFAQSSWFSTMVTQMRAALANVYNNALQAYNSATAAGNSAANSATYAGQAQDWATKTSGEVVAGQGYGAKKYAQDAASSAQQAAASVAALPSGTINDGAPSSTSAFSSQKVDAEFLKKSGGTLTGSVTGRILGVQGSDIASAAAINLTAAAGGTVDVTGSVSISSITLPAGANCEVRFTGAPLLVNSASLVLKGGSNIQAAAGDYAVFRGYPGGVVRCVDFVRYSGLPVTPSSTSTGSHYVDVMTGNGNGTTNTCIRRFTTTIGSAGTAITYTDSASSGAAFTINEDGMYSVFYSDRDNSSSFFFGVSLNSSELTQSIPAISASSRLGMNYSTGAGLPNAVSFVARLTAGSVVRPHNEGTSMTGASSNTRFVIRKIGGA